jgi:SAM-dependent methyltransferase
MTQYTRGSGSLEGFLARQRGLKADSLIKEELRQGRVLDIGCGTTPFFLMHTRFHEKHGIDPEARHAPDAGGVVLHQMLIDKDTALPFADTYFTAVVSLGTVEHFDERLWEHLLDEAYRLLSPGGQLVFTTPSPWTYGLLKAMASMNVISPQEIRDARHIRSTDALISALIVTGFKKEDISWGMFQGGLNRWFCAVK